MKQSFKNAEPILHAGEIDNNAIIGLRFTGQKSSNENEDGNAVITVFAFEVDRRNRNSIGVELSYNYLKKNDEHLPRKLTYSTF
jgi:hypothetical protein